MKVRRVVSRRLIRPVATSATTPASSRLPTWSMSASIWSTATTAGPDSARSLRQLVDHEPGVLRLGPEAPATALVSIDVAAVEVVIADFLLLSVRRGEEHQGARRVQAGGGSDGVQLPQCRDESIDVCDWTEPRPRSPRRGQACQRPPGRRGRRAASLSGSCCRPGAAAIAARRTSAPLPRTSCESGHPAGRSTRPRACTCSRAQPSRWVLPTPRSPCSGKPSGLRWALASASLMPWRI